MARTNRIFLDTSALFAGIWSDHGGGRLLLDLGEAGLVTLWVSSQVLDEIERTVRAKAPAALPQLALLLHRAQVQVADLPPNDLVAVCFDLTHHRNDAQVLAAAWHATSDFFVTLDKRNFLENTLLRTSIPFPMGTPGDCLHWLRTGWDAGKI